MNTGKNDPYLTAKIVRSYVRLNRVEANQISDLINTVHRAIGQLGQSPEPDEVLTPAVSVRRSVHRDYVVCLDCGYRGKTLRRHISVRHGLNGDEYRQRWGLRSDHPLTAPAYSEHRSTMAKARGFGRKSPIQVDPAPTPAASSLVDAGNPKARRTRGSRPVSKSEGATTETAARPTPARKRQSRARVASPSG
jgi:predicted transcriptional regulator